MSRRPEATINSSPWLIGWWPRTIRPKPAPAAASNRRRVLLIRGRHNHLLRRLTERLLDRLLLGGRVARWTRRLGLQGRLRVTRYDVPAIAPLAAPLRLAFASDFHAGPTTDPRVFEHLFEAVEAARPDVLLLGGDFVSCDARYARVLADHLLACRPPFGKFAVLGNHDLWVDDVELVRLLAAAGVEVLVNRNVPLAPPFDHVSICGMDDPWTGAPCSSQTFADARALRIWLTHAPDGLLLLADEHFDVGFAGHTHGGQVALPGGTPIVLPHGPLSRSHAYGEFRVPGSGRLIVSRGVGCSTVPFRINADPELVLCTLLPRPQVPV